MKPPLGLKPKNIHEELVKSERFQEVTDAIIRYYQADLEIPIEWVEEYNELIRYFKTGTYGNRN